MRCRKNVKDLADAEKRSFIKALKALRAAPSVLHPGLQSRYDDYVEIHRSAMDAAVIQAGQVINPGWGHFDSAFFPWHRELLFRFEEELRSHVPGVTIPYWDWTRGQGATSTAFPFTHTFIGVDGIDADQDRVEREAGAPTPYPYEFDPDGWTITVKDVPSELGFFRRAFGERTDAPGLPQNDVAVTGSGSSFRSTIGSSSYLTLRSRSEDIHNLVHRWAGGNMITGSSPNDPVFWMHHAQIDRMWTLWQEKHPGATPYVHTNNFAGHGLNDTLIYFASGNPAPWAGTATPAQLVDSHAMHATSIWYQSDLPKITLQGGSTVAFGSVPEGMTQYRAVHFRVQTCRQVRFRVVGQPSGNFSLPLGTQAIVEADLASQAVDGYVWVQFLATGTAPQSSSIVIEAYLLDDEGYYAATEGGEFVLGSYTLNLSASVAPRNDNSVVLVLDRSGSMGAAAGGSSTRVQLMKRAVSTFHALLRDTDEIGVVSFDDVTANLLPLTTKAAGLGSSLTGNGLDPRGSTAIGLGIQAGAAMLAGASHANRSLVVLTDGNQNVHPYINELPPGTVTSRTYAVGFGLPGQVSDAALHAITQNTQGDLTITGLLATQQETYLLTKAFVQILAEVTSANVVLDPQAALQLGTTHAIPFQVTEADVSIDVIFLAPAAVFAHVVLQTPGGAIIDPGVAAAEPNIEYHLEAEVAFYRIGLPALPLDPSGSHAGTWQILVRLRGHDEVTKLIRNKELDLEWGSLRHVMTQGSLPYSSVVHARSNLDFAATVSQSGFQPGAIATINATLAEYQVPFAGTAAIWADVVAPNGAASTLPLQPVGVGEYEATMKAAQPGVYRLRVRAEGSTSFGSVFTREKSLTVSSSAGRHDNDLDHIIEELRERDRALCELLDCLAENALGRGDLLTRLGFNDEELRRCVRRACDHLDRANAEPRPSLAGQAPSRTDEALSMTHLGVLAGQALLTLEHEFVPAIEWRSEAARLKDAEGLATMRTEMAENDDAGLMMFPRILDDCPADCDDPNPDHLHAPGGHLHSPGQHDNDHGVGPQEAPTKSSSTAPVGRATRPKRPRGR